MSKTHETKSEERPSFTVDKALESWNISARDWLLKHQKDKEWDGLATASIVFNSEGKVLMIQRASHDSMPNKWEVPGGAVDDDDATILHGAARELWEESGLIAKQFTHVVSEGPNQEPGHAFMNSTRTKTWCRFTFHVESFSCEPIKLDPHEHQSFVWASEEEVRNQMKSGRDLPITRDSMRAVILEAFRLRSKRCATL